MGRISRPRKATRNGEIRENKYYVQFYVENYNAYKGLVYICRRLYMA